MTLNGREGITVIGLVGVKLIEQVLNEGVPLWMRSSESATSYGVMRSHMVLTCSFSAQPPHQRTLARVQHSPTGTNIKQYCTPPRRKQ